MMRKLHFAPNLMEPVLDGDERITLRKYRPGAHDFKAGETVIAQFGEDACFLLRILADTETCTLDRLPDDVMVHHGFENVEAAFGHLKGYYPDLQMTDTIGVIRFELLTVDDCLVAIRLIPFEYELGEG